MPRFFQCFAGDTGRTSRLRTLAVVGLAFVARPPVALGGTLSLRSEFGAEYDSNANRAETLPNGNPAQGASPAASAGGRALFSADGTTRIADATAVSLSTKAAVRGYTAQAAREEGVAILQGTASVVQALGTLSRLMAMASYYDAFQGARSDSRDFRSIAPSLSLLRALGPGRLVLGGGYRWFAFKPAPVLDFSGVTAAAAYRMNLGAPAMQGDEDNDAADWELAGSITYEQRAFGSNLCVKGEDCPPLVSRGLRQDTFAQVAIDVTRTASHLFGAGVAMQLNGSNSYGDGLMRGLAHVDATFLLPANLSLATRAELTWTRYDQSVPLRRDPVSGLPIASIEDEGRSTLRVEILRPLGERFHISARWIGYTNEIGGGPVRYRRQTVLLALGVSLDLP